METNQTTQTTTMNKKMTNCKTCGMPMAKNAKKCPSCGARNTKKRIKTLLIVVAIFVVLTLMGFVSLDSNLPENQIIKAEIGETYTAYNETYKFSISSIEFYNGERLENYETYGNECISIAGTIENIGKSNISIQASDFEINFDNGYIYDSGILWIENATYIDEKGKECQKYQSYNGSVILEPLKDTSFAEFQVLMFVPKTVFDSEDKPISISVYEHKYEFDSVSELKTVK